MARVVTQSAMSQGTAIPWGRIRRWSNFPSRGSSTLGHRHLHTTLGCGRHLGPVLPKLRRMLICRMMSSQWFSDSLYATCGGVVCLLAAPRSDCPIARTAHGRIMCLAIYHIVLEWAAGCRRVDNPRVMYASMQQSLWFAVCALNGCCARWLRHRWRHAVPLAKQRG